MRRKRVNSIYRRKRVRPPKESMSEEENTNVEAELVEEVVQPEESTDSQEQVQETPEQRKARNDAEYNWAEMRKQMRQKDLEIAELRDQFSSINKKQLPPEEDEFAKLAEDDILTVAQAKKLATKLARQTAETVLKERDASMVDERMLARFPDYKSTLTAENIQILNELKPDVAESLTLLKDDPFRQAKLAYEYIKAFVPQRDVPMSKDKKKAEENSKKPLSVQSIGKQSAIGQAHQFENGLTPDLKAQLWKEMQQIKKGA